MLQMNEYKKILPYQSGMGEFLQSPLRLLFSIPFLLLQLQAEDFIYVLLRRLISDHILTRRSVLLVFPLLLRQQLGVLLGKLGHLGDGLAAQGVKGFFRSLMLGDLGPMLRQKLLLWRDFL